MPHVPAQNRAQPSGRLDKAFGAALIAQARSLNAYARRLIGSGADADDLVQDTMLRCWAARASFEPGSSVAAWARVVMRNSFLSGRRRARFHADLPEDAVDRLLGVAQSQEHSVELRDVDRAIGELSAEHRDAVVLASEGVTIEEGAARLQIPEGTYKSRLVRGRRRLRELTENRDAYRASRTDPEPRRSLRPRPCRDWTGVVIG